MTRTFTALRNAFDLRGMERRGRPSAASWLVTALVFAAMLTTLMVRTGQLAFPPSGLLFAGMLAWLPLLARTWAPLPVLCATVFIEAGFISLLAVLEPIDATGAAAMGAYQPAPIATMVAVFTVASRTPWRIGWMAGGGSATFLFIVGLLSHGRELLMTDLVMANVILLATGAGSYISSRRERAERSARESADLAQQAVLNERLRIAQELHDVLAHNLTLVNAQAAVAAYLMPIDPARASSALTDITVHTGRAIDELRATVGLLRRDDSAPDPTGPMPPIPTLADLDDLLDGFRAVGATVSFSRTGDPVALGHHGDLAAYRIVQDAPTNATKHAAGAPVRIEQRWSPDGVTLTITNTLPTTAGSPAPGTGHGLIGMRERALAVSGSLTAGRTPDGLFAVVASIPALAGGSADLPSPAESDPL